MHAFDRQTDNFLIAIPRLHFMQLRKNQNVAVIFSYTDLLREREQ